MKIRSKPEIYRKYHKAGGNPTLIGPISNISRTKQIEELSNFLPTIKGVRGKKRLYCNKEIF